MNTPIVPELDLLHNPPAQYYRISALICPSDTLLQIATGVLVQPDGTAILGQLRADPDDGTYTVAPFLAADSTYLPALSDWPGLVLPDPLPAAACAIPVPTTTPLGQGRDAA